jgi:hypothetical protein
MPHCSYLHLSRTSMFTARRSLLGGNKLVPSRTFCPRAVARGLAEEEKVKREVVDVTSFLEFSFCSERTLWLQLSRRRLGFWGGGRPAERGLRVLLHRRRLSGRHDMSWVKELFGCCLWFKILFGFGGCGDVLDGHSTRKGVCISFHLYVFFVNEYCLCFKILFVS